ncbi:LPXTG cell wall anchor domain-containing protein [Streptomyces sp. NPDC094032]|uniref:LPXTG cell wall anchor domain-containing protein n=1 Tax=Streptomyces sp. NPDC094032 TaxID=3155308 RepID=UPI00332B9C47
MKIRRILATAVAAAVTTPVVFLSAAPAFADTKPATGAEQRDKQPTLAELRLAVTKAQAVYEAAVVADSDAQRAMDEFVKPSNPLAIAAADAKKASTEAAAAKTAADEALTKAKDALAALPAEAPQADKDAAQKAVDDAQKLADEAKATATAKAEAYTAADEAYDDAAVELAREINKAQKAKAAALKALNAAKEELEAAEAEEPGEDDCAVAKNLATTLTGPTKIKAGTSAVFTLRVTNKNKPGGLTFDQVGGFVSAFSMEYPVNDDFRTEWSSAESPKWQLLNDPVESGFYSHSAVKPGGSYDFKLKVTVDAKAKAGDAAIAGPVGYENEGGACGISDQAAIAEFAVVKAAKPAPGKDSDKGGSTGGNGNTTEQGGSSKTPVTNGSGSTGGTLAKTGSSNSTLPIALTGGAAVVLGAGAMVLVRRRKAGADA